MDVELSEESSRGFVEAFLSKINLTYGINLTLHS